MFSGIVDYKKHSYSTRSSWGTRGTKNSCQDTGEAVHQSLNIFFFFFDGDIGYRACMREVSKYGLRCY